MSRMEDRAGISIEGRVNLLEADMDRHEALVNARLASIQRTLFAVLFFLLTALGGLAVNLATIK